LAFLNPGFHSVQLSILYGIDFSVSSLDMFSNDICYNDYRDPSLSVHKNCIVLFRHALTVTHH